MATINLSKALKARRGPIPLSQMLKGPPGFLERVGKHLAYPAIPPKGVELMPEHVDMPGMEEVGMAPTPTAETYTKLLQLAFMLKIPIETLGFILAGEAARPTVERALPEEFKMPATPSGMEAIPGFPGKTAISPRERALFFIEAGGGVGASAARAVARSALRRALIPRQLEPIPGEPVQARPTYRPGEAEPTGEIRIPPEPSPFREPTFEAIGGESALLGRGLEPGTMIDVTAKVPRGGRFPLTREDLILRDISPEKMEAVTGIPRRFGVKGPLAAGESPFPGRLPLTQILRGRRTVRGPEPLKAEEALVERVSKERLATLRRLRERGQKLTQEFDLPDIPPRTAGEPGPIEAHIERVQRSPDPARVRIKDAEPPTIMGEYVRGDGPNIDPEIVSEKPWGLLPLQVTRKDRAAHSVITRFIAVDDLTDAVALQKRRTVNEILERAGITRESPIELHNEIIFALESPRLARTMPPGEYQALASHVRSETWEVARLLRNEVEDPVYLMSVKDSLTGLPDDVAADFRNRIGAAVGAQDVAAVNAAVEEARAVGAKGVPFYLEGHFTHFPIEREFHSIFDELVNLSEQLALKDKTTLKTFLDKHRVRPEQIDPTVLRAIAANDVEATSLVQRIASLKARMGELERQRFRIIPEGGFYGPLSLSRVKGDAAFLRNIFEVYDQYIPGATRKMMLDQFLPFAKNVYKANEGRWSPSMKDYIYEFTASARGTIGARHKEWIRNFVRGVTGREVGHHSIDRFINTINSWQVAFKLGVPRLRALALQTTQPMMTLWPELAAQAKLLGIKNPAAAELAFIRGFRKAFFGKEGRKLATAVRAARSMQSRAEIVGDINQVQRAMLYLFDQLEVWNRTLAVSTGDELARMAGLRGIRAARFGRMISDNANYIYTIGNRPLILRGPFGRTFGIFKTFSINYASQAARLFRTDKNAFARMMVGLVGVGGTAAVPLYEVTRRVLLAETGVALPEMRGMADALPELIGLGSGFDLGRSLDPFGLPEDQNQILRFLAGPSVIALVDAIYGGPPEALGRLTSSIYPSFRGFGRAAEEFALDMRLHARTGAPLAVGRPPVDIVFGATGLQKTPEQLRFEFSRELRAAFKGDNIDEVRRIIAEARKRKIIISEPLLRGIQSDVMKERRGTMILPLASRILRALGGR